MAGRFWKEAASLIIVGRAANSGLQKYGRHHADYNLLFLKRSQKSRFMPNAFVFPGGVIENSDFSQEWLEVFEKCGYSSDDLYRDFRSSGPLPDMYTNKPQKSLLPEVGFRINAIRETFEECGLLLSSHQTEPSLGPQDLKEWQEAVHKDSLKFLKFFQEFGGCPAIWKLHEWSNWLTPTKMSSRRFDTLFFITFLDTIPELNHDDKEISGIQISSLGSILRQWHNEDLWLPPPQLYEISRFLQFTHFDKMKCFAQERAKKGLEQYLPVRVNTNSGVISVLPGDDLYPKTPDLYGEEDMQSIDSSQEELRQNAQCLHRLEFKSLYNCQIFMNISPRNGHVKPADFTDLFEDSKL
ncbi:acyl-coenzyme A diphosphatase NUDT19-like [Penaeus indicus]|uniref:acyl-coenzyme A diphosphatase NUDT19-like n=1 Tax=Penaeus indicus TaxID=29960 RepID=UPI00300C0BD6